MRPHHLSYAFTGTFLTGILCLRLFEQPDYPPIYWAILASIFLVSGFGIFCRKTRTPACLLMTMLLGIGFAMLRVNQTTHVINPQSIDFYAGSGTIMFTGIVTEAPDRRPLATKYTVSVQTIDSGATVPGIGGRVLVTDSSGWPQYEYGDVLQITGKLERPQPIDGFQYDRYLARYGIYAILNRPRIKQIGHETVNPVLSMLYSIRDGFEAQINRLLAEPYSSFLAGLLTGSRRGIPDHLTQDFNATGLTHIIAISGSNITLTLVALDMLFFWLPLRFRFLPSIIGISLFTLLTGASASVMRAAIMGSLGLLALHSGRLTHVRLALLWTATIMLAVNPKLLWDDAGFQLSFLAIIGITELEPLLAPLLEKLPERFGIREILTATIAAQLATTPWIAFLFGRISLIAPLANLLAVPLIPITMLSGFCGVLLSWFLPELALLPLGIANACLQWLVWIAGFLARLPFGSIAIAPGNSVLTIGLYLATATAVLILTRVRKKIPAAMMRS